MHPVNEATATLREVLKSLADVNPTFMATSEKVEALRELVTVESQVAELRMRVMATAGDVGVEAGDRTVACWLSRTQRLRRTDCASDLRLAEAVDRDRPLVARAWSEGRVNTEQARVIVAAIDELPTRVGAEVVDRAEAELIDLAQEFGPTELVRLGRRILDIVAPEVADQEMARQLAQTEKHAAEMQRLRMRAVGDGTTRISGIVPDATAARLATYLHAFTNPRLSGRGHEETGGEEGSGAGPFARQGHPRRLAEAFGQLLESLDPQRMPIHGGDATTVTVTISLDALRADLGTATLANGVPGDGHDMISAAQARRLACNAQIVPAVLGGDSEVLDVGRARRLFTKTQRRALLLRDVTCRAEGCDIPGTWAEAHHLVAWQSGGATDLDNALLLCSHHHHRVHDPNFDHRRLASGDLRFHRRR